MLRNESGSWNEAEGRVNASNFYETGIGDVESFRQKLTRGMNGSTP